VAYADDGAIIFNGKYSLSLCDLMTAKLKILSEWTIANGLGANPSKTELAEISETMGASLLRFGVQIPELLTQRKFVSVECHAHYNAHKPPKTVAPTVLMLEYKF